MQFQKFVITNYKGIRRAEIKLNPSGHARVFTLVGLNESGKTTILEAIHSFSPDGDSERITNLERVRRDEIPRHRIIDFSDEIAVTATIELDEDDKEKIKKELAKKIGAGLAFADDAFSQNHFEYKRFSKYQTGTFTGSYYSSTLELPKIKTKRQKKFRKMNEEEDKILFDIIGDLMPTTCYFPTFMFDFPDKIYLTNRNIRGKESEINAFFRDVFQDILSCSGSGYDIDEHIVNKIRNDEFCIPFNPFLLSFSNDFRKEQIQKVIDEAAKTVTQEVYEAWAQIFQESVNGTKEIIVDWNTEEGVSYDESGNQTKTEEHDICVEFIVKHGTTRHKIKTRSLGFRWFFTFLLFTQFRAKRHGSRPLLFLFDEPASNLHAAAQKKLIASFPNIAKAPHSLIYTTHSHYMIEPKWLEQAFIVQDTKISDSVIDAGGYHDSSIDIQAIPYRQFVNDHPTDTGYFQPILDRLNVVFSEFDVNRRGVAVEGKSDYYILRYIQKFHTKEQKDIPLFPMDGAERMGVFIGLMRGWGLPVRVILDADSAGKRAEETYKKDFYLDESEIVTIDKLFPACKKIEDVFSDEEKEIIKEAGKIEDRKINKKDICSIIQENLAGESRLNFGESFDQRAENLFSEMNKFFEDTPSDEGQYKKNV